MTVASILNVKGSDVATVSADVSLLEAVKLLEDKGIGALVVSSGGGAVEGIVSERDVVRALAEHGPEVLSQPIANYITREVVTCTMDERVPDLMAKMTQGRFRHMPVVEDGKLAGIVSIGDVVKQRIAEAENEAAAMRSYITAG